MIIVDCHYVVYKLWEANKWLHCKIPTVLINTMSVCVIGSRRHGQCEVLSGWSSWGQRELAEVRTHSAILRRAEPDCVSPQWRSGQLLSSVCFGHPCWTLVSLSWFYLMLCSPFHPHTQYITLWSNQQPKYKTTIQSHKGMVKHIFILIKSQSMHLENRVGVT